jgi:NodT family efflux transporter outer membrane factor (OMF) lipoprotein
MIRFWPFQAAARDFVFPFAMALATSLLAACSVGPDYVRPSAPQADAGFKEMSGWSAARPADDQIPTAWWMRYGDDQLNQLEGEVVLANQTLAQAAATYRQERALVEVARAAFFPDVGAAVGATRAHGLEAGVGPQTSTTRSVSLDATWEVDLWGAVRRAVEASQATAVASGATLANTQLSLQSELAIDYFQLRGDDATIALLNKTIDAYQKALTLTQNQYKVGVAQLSDVVLAQTQLVSTQAQAVDAGVMRAQLEHAIAVLTGVPPSSLTIAANPLTEAQLIPPPPVAVPSTLLQRRPDIATAERQVAYANAEIGVATAAYYPNLSLSASGGLSAPQIYSLFSAPARVWSVGAALAGTLFDGGARGGQLDAARAAYDANVANYRQTVLSAFQNVEDNLAGLRILENEYALQTDAVRLAQKAVDLQLNRYKAGTIAYTDVITAQTTLLSNQRSLVNLLSERVVYNVQLVKSLGGGWDDRQLAEPLAFVSPNNQLAGASAAHP